jgi:hypothetical protein
MHRGLRNRLYINVYLWNSLGFDLAYPIEGADSRSSWTDQFDDSLIQHLDTYSHPD